MAFANTEVRFFRNDKLLRTIEGHTQTQFVGDRMILWHAEYHPSSSGCTLIATDLETGKQLWKSHLKGIGPIDHTKYSNSVILELDKDVIRVWGKEAFGDYLEIVDRKTGKTVGHRVFRGPKG
jgi:hypothetical protein